ncbi:MAG: hypothetical protein OXN25_01445 [Candidatus Poribacteria bacterium]|nr:hypothetical protein [Candidatus Poribacteria bacterium]
MLKVSNRHFILSALVFFLMLPLIGTAENVHIPDPRLRMVLNKALGKGEGTPVTSAQLATLQHLDAPESGIRELPGLEFAARSITSNFTHRTPLKDRPCGLTL